MESQETVVGVSITLSGVRVEFTGTPESVMASVLGFLSKEVPNFELARNMTLNFSAKALAESFGHIIKLTPEGARIVTDGAVKLSDKDIVALQLVGARLEKELGKRQDDLMQVSEIQTATMLNPKSISSRVSELSKAGHLAKSESEAGKYRITTTGIHWLAQTLTRKTRQGDQ